MSPAANRNREPGFHLVIEHADAGHYVLPPAIEEAERALERLDAARRALDEAKPPSHERETARDLLDATVAQGRVPTERLDSIAADAVVGQKATEVKKRLLGLAVEEGAYAADRVIRQHRSALMDALHVGLMAALDEARAVLPVLDGQPVDDATFRFGPDPRLREAYDRLVAARAQYDACRAVQRAVLRAAPVREDIDNAFAFGPDPSAAVPKSAGSLSAMLLLAKLPPGSMWVPTPAQQAEAARKDAEARLRKQRAVAVSRSAPMRSARPRESTLAPERAAAQLRAP